MKTVLRASLVLLLGVTFLCGQLPPASAAAAAPKSAAPAKLSNRPPPGVEIAQAISMVTGVAISPLLGVGAVGAYKYFNAPEASRPDLAWYAQPWFWVPALLLVALVFLKDTAGTALPTALKKPLDIAEVFENKFSALVAAGALIPLINMMTQTLHDGDSALYQGMMVAAFDPASLLSLITVPVAIMVFFIVWMVSHVINVLIIVSPFTTVDAGLKSIRLAVLSSVTLTSFANPYLGAAWAIVIIVACYFLAGWAMRLTVFGSIFAWDFLTFRSSRHTVEPADNYAFTATAVAQTPVRSYGKLTRNEQGQLVLTYRPWLVLPAKQLILPEGTYAVGRGLFHPEILRISDGEKTAVLTLPPRYCGHEEAFNSAYQLAGIHSVGIQAVWDWVKSAFRSKPQTMSPASS